MSCSLNLALNKLKRHLNELVEKFSHQIWGREMDILEQMEDWS